MAQINIEKKLLNKIREESDTSGIRIFKLVEFAWASYKGRLKMETMYAEMIAKQNELQKKLDDLTKKHENLSINWNRANQKIQELNMRKN
jgi:hypothetical protein